jgi:hypothetical protein
MKYLVSSNGFTSTYFKPFLEPRSHKNAMPKNAKITEPDTIIFLENQDELVLHYSLSYDRSQLFIFIVQNKTHYKVKNTYDQNW